jgi:hypothetical protein
MSKFADRAEQFYMEQFNAMFSDEEKKSKEHKDIVDKFSKSNDTELFEKILRPLTEDAINPKKATPTKASKKKKMIAEEDGMDSAFDFETDEVEDVDPDDEPIEDDEFSGEGEEGDSMDEADEILQEIDLENIANSTKLELIRAIIDAAQNLQMEDEEMIFDDFIVELQTVIEEFQYEEEGEGAEDEVDFGGEEDEVDFEDETGGEEDFGGETEEETEEV